MDGRRDEHKFLDAPSMRSRHDSSSAKKEADDRALREGPTKAVRRFLWQRCGKDAGGVHAWPPIADQGDAGAIVGGRCEHEHEPGERVEDDQPLASSQCRGSEEVTFVLPKPLKRDMVVRGR